MKRSIKKLICLALGAGYIVFGLIHPDIYADAYVSASSSSDSQIGPGFVDSTASSQSTTISGSSSPDAADYAATNGVAQGSMTISTYIPEGAIAVLPLTVSSSLVETKDKYSYDDMCTDLAELGQKYPRYLSYTSLGKTADNRDIIEVIVGNSSASTQVLITASTHAREYITTLLVMKQIEYLLAYADTGAFDGKFISEWLDDVCIRFVPMVNPDGVSISEWGEGGIGSQSLRQVLYQAYSNDTLSGRTSLDFAAYLARWKANANGVNLNDNFASQSFVSGPDALGPSSEAYYGTAGSEAETRALQTLVSTVHFKAVLNYHATGSVIYWNYEGNPLVEHCRDLSNNIWALTGYTRIATGVEGGSFRSYLGNLDTPSTSLTIEVGQTQAPVSISEFDRIWGENMFVPLYTIKWAKEKGK